MTDVEEVTVQEAARRVGRSAETIRRWIWSGKLPATKRGNKYYVDIIHLEEVAVELDTRAWHSPEREQAQAMRDWIESVDRRQAEVRAERGGIKPEPLTVEEIKDMMNEGRM
jgi:excisionase family DNA binding protein